MTKQLRSRFPQVAWTLLAILSLAGCGAESTNIQGQSSSGGSSCSSLPNTTCVTGRLIDDAVVNVNYECGLSSSAMIRSVTDADGSFTCPNGSTATFSLINPDAPENRIVLGSVTVSRAALLNGENPAIPVYQYVTPQLLSGSYSGMAVSTRGINITRFLQTLSTDTTDADLSRGLPSRRIVISDDDKRMITAAVNPDAIDFADSVDATPSAPVEGSFDYAAKAYLLAVGKFPLIPNDKGIASLKKGINATLSGIYVVPGNSLLATGSLTPGNEEKDADTGAMVGYDFSSGKSFVGTLNALVDRRGRIISSGVYSYGVSTGPNPWAVYSDPHPMSLYDSGFLLDGFSAWPFDGVLSKFKFKLLGGAELGKFVTLDQGVIRRQAVAGSTKLYTQLFGETAAYSDLGRWSLMNNTGSTAFISGGAYTLERSVPVATWMNPDVWSDSVITFPLPITVSLYNQDYANVLCPGGRGCKMADIRMVILEDGNIISDRYHTCGVAVNPSSLEVNFDASRLEIPLGVVSSAPDGAKDDTGSNIKVLSLLAMLPDDARLAETMTVVPGFEAYIPYSQFSANSQGTSFIRVDGLSEQFQSYGQCKSQLVTLGLCTTADALQPKLAGWFNNYTFARALKAGVDTPNDPLTMELVRNSGGYMQMRKTTPAECVAP